MTNDECRMSNGGILSFYIFRFLVAEPLRFSKNILPLRHNGTKIYIVRRLHFVLWCLGGYYSDSFE
ncbi:hypothetical protein D1AOALGA4SA_1262 [Olavius algarvensis Delta 1 endosymbiont]|nr:hypothetical protein D1AOALGA4SA_1262 [Olavius algarvensis Delta 1 endosymbiont]